MTRFVIDCPSLLQLVRGGHAIDPAHSLVAPNSIRSEVLDLLLQEVRGGELTERAALDLHERMTEVKMRLLGDRVSRRTGGGSRESTTGAQSELPSTSPSPSCRPTP